MNLIEVWPCACIIDVFIFIIPENRRYQNDQIKNVILILLHASETGIEDSQQSPEDMYR